MWEAATGTATSSGSARPLVTMTYLWAPLWGWGAHHSTLPSRPRCPRANVCWGRRTESRFTSDCLGGRLCGSDVHRRREPRAKSEGIQSLFGRRPPSPRHPPFPPFRVTTGSLCPMERPQSLPLMGRVTGPWLQPSQLWNTGPPRANENTPSTASPPLSCHGWRCRVTLPVTGRDGEAGGPSGIPKVVGTHGGRSKPCNRGYPRSLHGGGVDQILCGHSSKVRTRTYKKTVINDM